MDDIDRRILQALQGNARMSLRELAEAVGLSSPSASERLKRLQDRKVIRGFAVDIDPQAFGYQIQAIVRKRDAGYESTAGQSVSLRWGGGLFVQAGDITGLLGGGAGPIAYKYATTTTGSKTTAKGRQEVTSTYTGPVETQQVRFSYVVQVGSGPQAHRIKIDEFRDGFEAMRSGNSGKVVMDWM